MNIPKKPPVHKLIVMMNNVLAYGIVGTIIKIKNIGNDITIASIGKMKIYHSFILLNCTLNTGININENAVAIKSIGSSMYTSYS